MLAVTSADVSHAPHDISQPSKARFALVVTLAGMFVANITLTILTIALPYIARDLGADRSATNWVTLGPMLVVAVITPPAGRMADSYGRKRIWLLGSCCSVLGMLGSALAPSLGPLLVARIVTGIGSALMVPTALALTTSLYPLNKRAVPIGYWTGTVAISPMLGVVLGGELLEHLSWRWLFGAQVALALPPLIAAWLGLDEQRFVVEGRFDWEGSVAVGLTSLALMMGATWVGHHALWDLRVVGAMVVALACGVWSVSAERRAQNPVLPPQLLADADVRMSIVSRLTLNFSYMGAFMTLPYLLAEVWKISSGAASLILLWRPLAMGLVGPFTGGLSARFGNARLLLVGTWAILLSTAAFLLLDAKPASLLLSIALGVAGAGLGLTSPAVVALVTSRVGPELLGTASGMMSLTATLANALGMAGLFAVVEANGGVQSAHAYRVSFAVATVVVGVGLWAALALRQIERSQRSRRSSQG
jgi:DHA2 family methylenomycin A resistance protein-like MFS transporter